MKRSKAAAWFVTACGLALVVPPALFAQQPARPLSLSSAERASVTALQAAAAGTDRAAQDAALATARAPGRGADARYAVASLQHQIGIARGDLRLQAEAVDEMIASGVPQGGELVTMLANQASRAFSAGDFQRTDRLLTRMTEIQPNNGAILADHGQLKARLGDRAQAVALLQRAIDAQRTAGQAVPESWYTRALALAFDGRSAPQVAALGQGLVATYPTPVNWRDALLGYRQTGAPDPGLDLDIRRLHRAASGLTGERDYLDHAQAMNAAGLPGEAKATLDEGVSLGMLSVAKPIVRQLLAETNPRAAQGRAALAAQRTRALAAADGRLASAAGDTAFGFGQYSEAAELYRAALLKGGEDPNLLNTRLGAALALAGQRADAELALRAVTGPRAELAGFWLAWLSRRPA